MEGLNASTLGMARSTPSQIIFFPWRALFTFMGLGAPFAMLLGHFINPNAGYILMVTIVGQYLIYESFHYCCHVRDNWFVRNMPFVNTIRRHHTAHHNYGIMMSHNMNLTFPIADWVMGTSDLERGLVGTLLWLVNNLCVGSLGGSLLELVLAVTNENSTLSYTRSGAPIPSEKSPKKLFEKLFIQGKPSEIAANVEALQQGRSLLDFVGDQQIQFGFVPGFHRRALDNHAGKGPQVPG